MKKKMRGLFEDGGTSFVHLLSGALGWTATLLSVGYQLFTYSENTPVDIAEVLIGFFIGRLLSRSSLGPT